MWSLGIANTTSRGSNFILHVCLLYTVCSSVENVTIEMLNNFVCDTRASYAYDSVGLVHPLCTNAYMLLDWLT